ncbi:hypothetical protein T479_12710 [Lysinibacillus varians]|nr:hypothetical protein T479_12710 [Lysinibacillus varians]
MPTVTANYTLNMPSYRGGLNSKVENAAIRNVEYYKQAKAFFEKFNRAFLKLTQKERQIIVMACLEETPLFNYQSERQEGGS